MDGGDSTGRDRSLCRPIQYIARRHNCEPLSFELAPWRIQSIRPSTLRVGSVRSVMHVVLTEGIRRALCPLSFRGHFRFHLEHHTRDTVGSCHQCSRWAVASVEKPCLCLRVQHTDVWRTFSFLLTFFEQIVATAANAERACSLQCESLPTPLRSSFEIVQ